MAKEPQGDAPGRAWDMRPVPDPTVLTTEQLTRAISAIREVLETRLDGMDKAIELLQSTSDKFPARMDEKIASLRDVHEERFRSIQTQFSERDVRTDQTSRDSKVAVDAALSAAKEAVSAQNVSAAREIAKSELSTAKQIDQQALLIATTAKASDEKVDDLKQRLTRIEGRTEGVDLTTKTSTDQSHWLVAIVLGIGTFVAGYFIHRGGP